MKKNEGLYRFFATLFAAALALAMLISLCSCGFSYEKSNLKRYVDLPREEYYGITVSIPAAKSVEEADVDLEIDTFLLELRTLVSEGEKSRHAQWGDNVNLYYYITVEQENGWNLPPDGFSNMATGEPGAFVIGGGVLPQEIEDHLTGRAATETAYSPLFAAEETVKAGDVVYLDFTYRLTDGENVYSGAHEGVRVDLSKTDAGTQAAAFALSGLHPGDRFDFGIETGEPLVADWDGDGENETLAASGTVSCVSRGEELGRVEADVAADYFDEAIAGKHAVMLYAIDSVDAYDVPELTEELLEEHVPDFVPLGGDLTEEFRDYVRQLLQSESRREWHAAIEEKLWEHFDSLDCIKKYPSDALRNEIAEQEKQLEGMYVYYGAMLEEEYGVNPFETVEDFGYAYYELDGSGYADVHEYLKKYSAPRIVRQKLIIFYIADREGWAVSEEEYESELPRQLSYYADAEGSTSEEVLKKYGEDFFRQAVQYNKVLTNLVSVTNVN